MVASGDEVAPLAKVEAAFRDWIAQGRQGLRAVEARDLRGGERLGQPHRGFGKKGLARRGAEPRQSPHSAEFRRIPIDKAMAKN